MGLPALVIIAMSVEHIISDDAQTTTTHTGLDQKQIEGDKYRIEADTGNKQYVAEIIGTHDKYGLDRDFIAYQQPKTSDRVSVTHTYSEGDLIEERRYTHSGKNHSSHYLVYTQDGFVEVTEDEAEQIAESL
jgi:hypothetical protein